MIDTSQLKGIYTFAATIVGAGILALPVFLGAVGFLPGSLAIIFVGVLCVLSALFIAESSLRSEENLYFPGLCNKFLGRPGFYLMFLGILIYIYGALMGYLSAGGQVLYEISQGAIPVKAGILIYFFVGALIIHFGIKAVESGSTILFCFMLLLFFGMIWLAFSHLDFDLLKTGNWNGIPATFGILLFAFTGHTILPSLIRELRQKPKAVRNVAIFGVALPLVMYLIWFFAVSAVVPYGDAVVGQVSPLLTKTLSEAKAIGQPATFPLAHLVGGPILILALVFSLFATFTSFLGFGVSLRDSFFDLKIKKGTALFLTVVPPLIFAFFNPDAFLKILDLAGLYGAGIFVGILPPLMVIKSREKRERVSGFVAPGGNTLPWLVFFLFLGVLVYKTIDIAI